MTAILTADPLQIVSILRTLPPVHVQSFYGSLNKHERRCLKICKAYFKIQKKKKVKKWKSDAVVSLFLRGCWVYIYWSADVINSRQENKSRFNVFRRCNIIATSLTSKNNNFWVGVYGETCFRYLWLQLKSAGLIVVHRMLFFIVCYTQCLRNLHCGFLRQMMTARCILFNTWAASQSFLAWQRCV